MVASVCRWRSISGDSIEPDAQQMLCRVVERAVLADCETMNARLKVGRDSDTTIIRHGSRSPCCPVKGAGGQKNSARHGKRSGMVVTNCRWRRRAGAETKKRAGGRRVSESLANNAQPGLTGESREPHLDAVFSIADDPQPFPSLDGVAAQGGQRIRERSRAY